MSLAHHRSSVETLLERVHREGDVLSLGEGSIGIFDPTLMLKMDMANSQGLRISASPIDRRRIRTGDGSMAWRDVRALLLERNRGLNTPEQLERLHRRMRGFFSEHAGESLDLTWLTARAVSRPLIPLIISGLSKGSERALIADQEAKLQRQLDAVRQSNPLGRRLSALAKEVLAGRAIARALRRRLHGQDPPRQDFAETVLTLVDRIGFTRASYVLGTLLTAVSTAPAAVAACILYELVQRPEWRDRIRLEMNGLAAGEIYSAPHRKLPIKLRFIREAMRLWAFPLVTRRVVDRDLEVEGMSLTRGSTYDFSAYVMHHSDRY